MMIKRVLVGLSLSVLLAPQAIAKEDYIMDTSDVGRSHNGVIRSDQFLELGMGGANALRIEGESNLRNGHLDRAITVLQRSVEMAPMDMDGRILYAQALEQKLISQKERDPALFNFLVKQWLFVAKKAEFADQAMQGRSHLMNLTGVVPKLFEKEPKFLARVLMPEDGSQQVALGAGHTSTKGGKVKNVTVDGGGDRTSSIESFLR
jgi:hypothetical protein